MPISVTNKIDFVGNNPACDSVDNALLAPEEIDAATANSVGVLFAPGDVTVIQQSNGGGEDGLANSAGSFTFKTIAAAIGLLTFLTFHIFAS